MDDEGTRAGRELEAETLTVLGRLAGGIAHDINNQLTSIIGYADLLLFDLPGDSVENATTRQDLIEIRQAAERAYLVTKQLLAFSRPGPAAPAIVNVAGVVAAHLHLLRRILGSDIQLATSVARDTVERDPGLVRADPSHLGHVLIGLAARARHALPRGGTLTIEVANDNDDGEAVRLSVDARRVADAAATARASDFAVIDDLVRRSGGRVQVDRADAQGLRVSVFLPRIVRSRTEPDDATNEGADEAADEGVIDPPRGIEHVLVVDADDGVRELVRTVLERHGYQVEVAARPSQALLLASAQAVRLELAIIDIMLPEQRGDALAAALIARRPGLRVLHLTGHAHEPTVAPDAAGTAGDSVSSPAAFLLRKPFSAAELLVAVRQAIDSIPAAQA